MTMTARHAALVLLLLAAAGCGGEDEPATTVGQNADPAAREAPQNDFEAFSECMTSAGIEMPDMSPGAPIRQGTASYPPEVAAEAWSGCRDLLIGTASRPEALTGLLAFRDCMAERGWPLAADGPAEDRVSYDAALHECRTPAEGETREASYCRHLVAVRDQADASPLAPDPGSLSSTGVPNVGSVEERLAVAVRLYEESLELAPDDIRADVLAMRDSYRSALTAPGTSASADEQREWEERAVRLESYNQRTCGMFFLLGALD